MVFKKEINGKNLTIDDLYKFLDADQCKITISTNSKTELKKAFERVEKFVKEKKEIYGTTNAYGIQKYVNIHKENQDQFSKSILLSHSTSMGQKFNNDIIRLTLLIKANQ